MKVDQLQAPMAATLGGTEYFEVESVNVGARFAVWVTLPLRYGKEPNAVYPVIYQPDGNLSAPLTAPVHPLLTEDPINPIVPFIQVNVGYVGEDVKRALAVRARDLLPPGEPLAPGTSPAMMDALVDVGILDKIGADLY